MSRADKGMRRTLWTAEQLEFVTRLYPNTPTVKLAEQMGRTARSIYQKALQLGLRKSAEYMATEVAGRFDGIRGGGARFPKGHKPWNTGLKGLQIGGKATRFKQGQVPTNHRPVGSTRIDKDGYQIIKVAEPKKWEPLHRHVWKQAGKTVPRGMALVFKDGDKLNCDLENLELISRMELMNRNTVHRLPKELAELVQLTGALNRQINKRTGK